MADDSSGSGPGRSALLLFVCAIFGAFCGGVLGMFHDLGGAYDGGWYILIGGGIGLGIGYMLSFEIRDDRK